LYKPEFQWISFSGQAMARSLLYLNVKFIRAILLMAILPAKK
jgi:hypothetical protein